MLASYHVLLRRALAPLERLTELMRRVDPLAPGQRGRRHRRARREVPR